MHKLGYNLTMNIFYIDENPYTAARYMNNKHVVKMIVESAQLLCTAHRMLDGYQKAVTINGTQKTRWCMDDIVKHNALYQCTHANHPSAIWARASIQNYHWLYEHFLALMSEYTFRYGKHHKSEFLIPWLENPPVNMVDIGFTPPPQAMPEEYKHINTVTAYRQYYCTAKLPLAQWKIREIPEWYLQLAQELNPDKQFQVVTDGDLTKCLII